MKKIVRIMLDYLQGPIWISDIETGMPMTGVDAVDYDAVVKELNQACADRYNSYYEFDSHDQACWFNYEQEKADKEIMLSLISQLIERLNEINDGSFIIEDLVTERLKKL